MRRMLLVEDNEDDIELTVRALRKHKLEHELVIARNGDEALDLLCLKVTDVTGAAMSSLPEVVLLDLKLPGLSGLEVLRAIRASERTRLLPVVVLTSSSEDTDIVESYEKGANSYVRKPVDFSDFLDATRQLAVYWLVLNQRPSLFDR